MTDSVRVTTTHKTTDPATRQRSDDVEFAVIEGENTLTGARTTRFVSRWQHPDVDDYDATIKRVEAEVRRSLERAGS